MEVQPVIRSRQANFSSFSP